MIHEVTVLTVDLSQSSAFEAVVASCSGLFSEASGCKSMRLGRTVETAGLYELRVGWETYDDHVISFRNSEAYEVWRSRVGPFFKTGPSVSHIELVAEYFDCRAPAARRFRPV